MRSRTTFNGSLRIAFAALAALIWSMPSANAAKEKDEKAEADTAPQCPACPAVATPEPLRHVLAEHGYMPSTTLLSPFADSESTVIVGLGIGTFTTNILGVDKELSIGAFQPGVSGQLRIFN